MGFNLKPIGGTLESIELTVDVEAFYQNVILVKMPPDRT